MPIYEGMPLGGTDKGTPKIVFGRDTLCPSCRGRRIELPMSSAEKSERKRQQRQGKSLTDIPRWPCSRCGGVGVARIDD